VFNECFLSFSFEQMFWFSLSSSFVFSFRLGFPLVFLSVFAVCSPFSSLKRLISLVVLSFYRGFEHFVLLLSFLKTQTFSLIILYQ